ncbi:unnamed protein product [Nesidiocoris tenuis]|uniref:Uncharacterized protein n=1 Tax=Nesidiocoris tenuis TaxID=355587 RepID=A0A6H5HH23_9HEMI|nr:unnamed protein product [Nesidiocoris tenuis]
MLTGPRRSLSVSSTSVSGCFGGGCGGVIRAIAEDPSRLQCLDHVQRGFAAQQGVPGCCASHTPRSTRHPFPTGSSN